MTPEAVTARRGTDLDPSRHPGASPSTERRAPLRVVAPRSKRRRPIALVLSAALVTGTLLAVVVAHALVAEGQVRLTAARAALSAEQAQHRQEQLATAKLEMPSRIVQQAETRLGMVRPTQITQIPYTPLAGSATAGSARSGHGSTSGSAAAGSATAGSARSGHGSTSGSASRPTSPSSHTR